MVENPDRAKQVTQAQSQAISEPTPIKGTRLGFQTSPTFCKCIIMPNGEAILNKNWKEGAFSVSASVDGYTASIPESVSESDDDSDDDNDNDDDKTANCGGVPCTPREKEDSWTDEDFNEERSRDRCEAVQDSGCDEAVEKEEKIAEEGAEIIDGERYEYDPNNYWLPEGE